MGHLEIIRHRTNQIRELHRLDKRWGVEFDVRTQNGKLVLSHDPFSDGDLLQNYLREYAHLKRKGLMVLNPKEDGIEDEILNYLNKCSIQRFFFLDLTVPTMVRLSVKKKLSCLAVRVSEYESLSSALRFKGLADWVWLDCFNGTPLPRSIVRRLKENFKLCLVSPELQGYPVSTIYNFKKIATWIDAVCTKVPDFWQ